MTAVNEPLRFFAWPFSPVAATTEAADAEDADDCDGIEVSDGDVDNESDFGEFAADLRADILGFPPELAPDECFGDEIECLGLAECTGECLGLCFAPPDEALPDVR